MDSRLICFRFLGPRMIYTSGIILNPDIEESLETLQDNKLAVVCNKLDLKPNDRHVQQCCLLLFVILSF
jgi:sphingolipid C9-methyltransferase